MEIIVNDQPRRVAERVTVAELLGQLDLTTKYVAVEVNRQLVPRRQHTARQLSDGDRLEIVTLVGGG